MTKSLEDVIVELHYLARIVEKELGAGNLSEDIRNCADRLSDLITKTLDKFS